MVEADPVGDIDHPEDIGVEMRETRYAAFIILQSKQEELLAE